MEGGMSANLSKVKGILVHPPTLYSLAGSSSLLCSQLKRAAASSLERKRRKKEEEATHFHHTQGRKSMAASSFTFPLFVFILILACLVSSASPVLADDHHQLGWIPARSACTGSIAECMASGDEFEMESEVSRRILATTRYISYQALRRNSVPCSRRGASYYNCQPGAQANPYRRGCSAITRCRS